MARSIDEIEHDLRHAEAAVAKLRAEYNAALDLDQQRRFAARAGGQMFAVIERSPHVDVLRTVHYSEHDAAA